MKWKLEIEMKLLEKNGIRIKIDFFFKMEITLVNSHHRTSSSDITNYVTEYFEKAIASLVMLKISD